MRKSMKTAPLNIAASIVSEARKKILAELEEQDLLVKVEPHVSAIRMMKKPSKPFSSLS